MGNRRSDSFRALKPGVIPRASKHVINPHRRRYAIAQAGAREREQQARAHKQGPQGLNRTLAAPRYSCRLPGLNWSSIRVTA